MFLYIENMNVGKKTANTILEEPKEVVIGSKTYLAQAPKFRTLIKVSGYINELPYIDINDDEDVITSVLRVAHKCDFITDILAILIVGTNDKSKWVFQLKNGFIPTVKKVNPIEELSKEIADNLNTDEIFNLIVHLLADLKVAFFLNITTFLNEINLTKPTKASETTASGQ